MNDYQKAALGYQQKVINKGSTISNAREAGVSAFWAAVSAQFPDINTGDMDPTDVQMFDQAADDAIRAWLSMNK